MRLQKQLSRAVEGKEYPKYVLVVPPTTIDQLQWKEGEELEHEVKDQSLVVRKVSHRTEDDALKLIDKHRKAKKK
jgi:antitoxin component of MazEF toxin-antitoxin module